jgi:iron complex transport system substrate-binding protein
VSLPQALIDEITRREFGAGLAALSALLVVGCGNDEGADATRRVPEGFRFSGDDRVTVELDGVPTRIAAWISNAAALAAFGVKLTGVWGPPELARGIDLAGAESFGKEFALNLEAMAASRPELIVGNVFNGDFSLPQAEEFDPVKKIAPLLRLEANGPITKMIETHERLAVALGVDPESPALVAERKAFRDAREGLRSAIAEKPGLKVVCLALMRDHVFVNWLDYAPLIDLADLGMDVHDNVDDDPDWGNGFSWELVPTLEADLIIWDERPRFLKPQDLGKHPIWKTLPAVRAGQVVPYPFDAPLTYGFMTETYRTITEAVRAARPDLV